MSLSCLKIDVKKYISESKVAQSCPTFCDPMDCSLPGSSIHGIFQARIQEWIAISFSRASSRPKDGPLSHALQGDSLPAEPLGPRVSPFFVPFSHTSSSSPGRTGRTSSPFSKPRAHAQSPPLFLGLRDTALVSKWTLPGPRTRLPGPQSSEGSQKVYGQKGRAPESHPLTPQ